MQAALKIVLEPIFEADFLPCSFGFRPKRAAHDALQVLLDESFAGQRWVVETDIANCFDKITAYAEERMCLFVGKRHKRGRRYGRAMLIASGHRLGLINLHGVVVAPRPNRAWRVTPNTAGEGRR